MNITIRYDDGTEVKLADVQSIRMISYHTVIITIYGSGDTMHKNVFNIKCEIWGILN